MNITTDSMTLEEIFSAVESTFFPTPPQRALEPTVDAINVILDNIKDSLIHDARVGRTEFNPESYHRRLIGLFTVFISGAITIEFSAEELHRIYCEIILRSRVTEADRRSVLAHRDNFITDPPPLAWYFNVIEHNFERSQTVNDNLATLRDIIMMLDWMFYQNRIEWLDQNKWKALFGDAMLPILTACYVSDISPELLIRGFRETVVYL